MSSLLSVFTIGVIIIVMIFAFMTNAIVVFLFDFPPGKKKN